MKTIWGKLNDLRQRHAKVVALAIGLLAVIVFLLGQAIPDVEDWMVDSNAMTLLIVLLVLDISYALSQIALRRQITISRDQDEDRTEVLELIKNSRIDEADLLEYSTAEALAIIKALKERQCRMRILVKHPESVLGDTQRDRIITQVKVLMARDLHNYDDASIKFYRQPASIRGRRLGGAYVNLSWYTPNLDAPDLEVLGDTNPLITADLTTREGRNLLRMFQGLFDRLWDAEGTEDAKAVLERMKSPPTAVTT
jgi:hypothetical protein